MTHHLSRTDDTNKTPIFEVFLRNIMRSLPQYIFLKDQKSVYLGCNENFARLVGLNRPEDIVGKSDQNLNWQPGGHTAEIFRQGDQDTLNGHPINNQEETLVLPDGKKLVTLVSKLPIMDDDGRPLGIVGYFTDITALKDQERELRQAKQQADAANQAKSAFITHISHDMRTPLSGILGTAQQLAERLRNKSDKAIAEDLIQSSEVLLNFLNEVIEFSKYAAGDLPVYDIQFNLREIVDHIVRLVKPSVQEKKLDFHVEYDPKIPSMLIGDPVRIQRILLNLVSNAIKFTPQGSVELRLTCIRRKHRHRVIQLEINDTGIGIPPDKQTLIFTRFERLHPAYQGRYPGFGLGLALVKQFITELDGEISVNSREKQGTCFTVLIPLRESLSPQNSPEFSEFIPSHNHRDNILVVDPAASANTSLVQNKRIILVVEDNLIVQKSVQNMLMRAGFQVHTADNGAQALTQIKLHDYDCVVMDLGLPDQDGCIVAKEIRSWQQQNQRPISIIVALSAHLDEESHQRCLKASMVKTFVKPLDVKKIQEISSLLKTEKQKKQKQPHSYRIDKNKKNSFTGRFRHHG
jgi:two-component system, OmpR family, aerobic respiration control sensor histidine kinase ArcB